MARTLPAMYHNYGNALQPMNVPLPPPFATGDRVVALRRPGFPAGTVLKLLDIGFVLVRWDGNALETAHATELAIVPQETD